MKVRNRLIERGICTAGGEIDMADFDVMKICQEWPLPAHPTLKPTQSSTSFGSVINEINVAVVQYHASLLAQHNSALQEMNRLKHEVRKLRTRVDKIDALYAVEDQIDKEIAEEIENIVAKPINVLDYKPSDWLPTGDEMDKLLEDE